MRKIGSIGLLMVVAACSAPQPDPHTIRPLQAASLDQHLREATIAVLTFSDGRPDTEHGPYLLNDTFIDSTIDAPGYYWNFRGENPSNLPSVEDSMGQELFVRSTGDPAFRWYRFPYSGIDAPRPVEPAIGISDYLALSIERRGLVPRVVRCDNLEQAREAGADYAVRGTVQHFVGLFTEIHEPRTPRPDDIRNWKINTRLSLQMTLVRIEDDETILQQTLALPDREEDALHLFDELARFRGVHFRPLVRLDAENQARYAFHDLASHLERGLEEVTVAALDSLEEALGQSRPLD